MFTTDGRREDLTYRSSKKTVVVWRMKIDPTTSSRPYPYMFPEKKVRPCPCTIGYMANMTGYP